MYRSYNDRYHYHHHHQAAPWSHTKAKLMVFVPGAVAGLDGTLTVTIYPRRRHYLLFPSCCQAPLLIKFKPLTPNDDDNDTVRWFISARQTPLLFSHPGECNTWVEQIYELWNTFWRLSDSHVSRGKFDYDNGISFGYPRQLVLDKYQKSFNNAKVWLATLLYE